MFFNLKGEMARKNILNKEIAKRLDISERALRNKISGISDFSWKEVCTIQEEFFPEVSKEYLFTATKTTA